jgi:hypothetical protein
MVPDRRTGGLGLLAADASRASNSSISGADAEHGDPDGRHVSSKG